MRAILIFLVALWFLLNLVRVGNNLVKIYTEELTWISMDDSQKEELLLGESHIIWSSVLADTKKDAVIAVNVSDPNLLLGGYYLALYYLYPRQIKFVDDINIAKLKKDNFSDLLVVHGSKKGKTIFKLIKI